MEQKIVGKMNSTVVALMVISLIAPVAKNIKIIIWDKIKKEKVLELEVDSKTKEDDIQKLLDYLMNEKKYRYAVEIEATTMWPYSVDAELLKAFNIPNCCEVSILE
jgi:hypothetical protein